MSGMQMRVKHSSPLKSIRKETLYYVFWFGLEEKEEKSNKNNVYYVKYIAQHSKDENGAKVKGQITS